MELFFNQVYFIHLNKYELEVNTYVTSQQTGIHHLQRSEKSPEIDQMPSFESQFFLGI